MSNTVIWGTPTEVVKDSYVDPHGNEYYLVTMQDGKKGNYACKSGNDPYFKVDVAVQYVIEEKPANNKEGVYIKFKKPPQDQNQAPRPQSNSGGKGRDNIATGMMVGNALNNAVLLVSHGRVPLEDLEKIANRICEISIKLKANWDGQG